MKPTEIPEGIDLADLHIQLRTSKCSACSLGEHPQLKGPVVSKGLGKIPVMILGEAPGKDEDAQGIPFVGKAGKLLDEWLNDHGLDPSDFYISNLVRCRPIAIPGSGKQNLTPKAEHIRTCKPYLLYEIKKFQPRLIITLGMSATKGCLTGDIDPTRSLREISGKFYLTTHKNRCRMPAGLLFYPTYHPAALLHNKSEEVLKETKKAINIHFNQIKEAINELR